MSLRFVWENTIICEYNQRLGIKQKKGTCAIFQSLLYSTCAIFQFMHINHKCAICFNGFVGTTTSDSSGELWWKKCTAEDSA